MGDKKINKMMMNDNPTILDEEICVSLNEPHKDFIFNNHQYFSHWQIEEYVKLLKNYFPNEGSEYNYIIDLLYRGVGVYVKGLPEPYLRIVQNLACNKQLAIVFSDESLVFGVSMPFRTSVITRDEDLDSMMYHQMAGRAGRRGLDKQGNIVFVEQSWKRIKNLSTSVIPSIKGIDTIYYGNTYASKLSKNIRWNNLYSNFLLKDKPQEDIDNFYEMIKYNISNGNAWEFVNSDEKNFNSMLWKFRSSEKCFRIPIFIQFIKKLYRNCNPVNQKTQIECSKLLSLFINPVEVNEDFKYKLTNYDDFFDTNIHEFLSTLALDIPDYIDGRIYLSIQQNKLFDMENKKEYDILREELMKFANDIKNIQHYFFHINEISITRLLGKLLTRILWIYLSSSSL